MIKVTKYNDNTLSAESYTVECGEHKRNFPIGSEKEIGKWIEQIWNADFFPMPAFIYKNIGWDADHILYRKYELV